MNYPQVLYCYPEMAGEPFLPSNGTEGMEFCGEFCDNCKRQHPDPDNKLQCFEILMPSLMGEQPKEWVFNSQGWPVCKAWERWDWGNDNGDGYNEPPKPEPEDPDQLLLPFDIEYLFPFWDDTVCVTKRGIFERELITQE